MADRRLLTDRFLRALPPAPKGQRVEVWDSRLKGFGVRVTDAVDADPSRRGKAGRISFILYARFGGAAPARRTIGIYGSTTLEAARRTAGEWRSQIAKGIDPAVVEAEAIEKAARERAARIKHSFATVADAFIKEKLSQERSGKASERDLKRVFVKAWADRPVSDITKFDVLTVINAIKPTAPQMARAMLILIKRFFGWVVDQHVYGLEHSPCDRLVRAKLLGEPPSRTRRLSDIELAAFWRASGKMGYPVGSAYRLLLLTGLRLNEAAKLAWSEVQNDTLVIPPERMKGKNGKAREHRLPLPSAAQDILAALPRYRGGKYLFSYSAGETPVALASPNKRDLDRRMVRSLKAMARRRGEDHHTVELPRWTIHDLRRNVRSGLAQLRVPRDVAESILAHRPPGIVGVYDVHAYEDEKREALEKWARHLASIVNPAPAAKVVKLRGRRR